MKKIGITYEKVKKLISQLSIVNALALILCHQKNDSAYDDTIQAKSGYVDVMKNIVGHASYVPINL